MYIVQVTQKITQKEKSDIVSLLKLSNWNEAQIHGQIKAIEKFIQRKECIVYFAVENDEVIGFAFAEFYAWNRLGQIHGLAVHNNFRMQGIASLLVHAIEDFMKNQNARGVYVDTPVDNLGGCAFYEKNDYKKGYIMPSYYDQGQDGITFQKFFSEISKF